MPNPNYNFDTTREAAFTPLIRDKNDPIPDEFMNPQEFLYLPNQMPQRIGSKIMHVFLAHDADLEINRNGTHSVRGANYYSSDELYIYGWGDAVDRAWSYKNNNNTAAFDERVIKDILQDPSADLRNIIVARDPRQGGSVHWYGIKSARRPHNDLW